MLGASASLSAARRRHALAAAACGLLAGMAPDLDSLITSDRDPLLYLEYHRQFTHALVFIPVGAALCALVLHPLFRRTLGFAATWAYCALGYATHGLLDACTTYGTQLLWPFSNARIAWHTVSIIDPLFTLPIALLVLASMVRRRPIYARTALVWALVYLSFGALQRERAEAAGAALASARGHVPVRLEAKPSFANLIVWKTVYETATHYHVDAARVVLDARTVPGVAVPKLDLARDLPWLDANSQQARDVERFRWFSNGYLALDPARPDFVVDIRYSLVPNEAEALWGIRLDREAPPDAHAAFVWDRRVTAEKRARFLAMLRGS